MRADDGGRLRALLDANVLISYLLRHGQPSAIADVVESAAEGRFTLLLPSDLVAEFASAVASKPYLARRISVEQADEFIAALSAVAEIVPSIDEPIPAATRDPKDDYLLAYALVGSADYLVSGDRDLLSLGQAGGTRIVSPTAFLEVLRKPSAG